MAGTAKKWFIGCGIGCGLFLLLIAGAGTVGYFGVRQAIDRGEDIEAGFEQLRAEYGGPGDYIPAPDGSVPADRMEVFLAARQDMAIDRKQIGDILRTLDDQEVDGAKPGFIQKTKAGIQLIPSLMTFIDLRSHALLNAGMGLGEYLYIYSLSYYNLLARDLADGPSFQITGEDQDGDNNGFHWDVGPSSSDGGSTTDEREKVIRRYLHRIHLQMARNQLEGLDGLTGDQEDRTRLVAEIAALEDESLRLFWETGMPAALRESLEPYRDRLEASYDPMVNVLESGLVENE